MKTYFVWMSICLIFMLFPCNAVFPASSDKAPCTDWVAKVVSLEGRVEILRAGRESWQSVETDDLLCPGDAIQVYERSRAALFLINETVLRLDEHTRATISAPETPGIPLFELLKGAVHFFSRFPDSLKIITPFVNAAIKGTEFLVRVQPDQSIVTLFEGHLQLTNAFGSLTMTRGQSAVAFPGKSPEMRMTLRPRDAVQWALYYPRVLDEQYPDCPDSGRLISQAATLLSVGRSDTAGELIRQSLAHNPSDACALALLSVICLVHDDKQQASEYANKAVAADPRCAPARIALSYVQQSRFDLEQALSSARTATRIHPDDGIAWCRLSELWMSFGHQDKAMAAARKASELRPELARSQTVLGFAFLTRIEIKDAIAAFSRGIKLDPGDPLPQLGLGLAIIREGRLEEGRRHIEIAASLDPNNSLIRSYLGKAFYEEKRDQLAADQLAVAKELDPKDPTPWLYDAILKQTSNRPVEALDDIQKSMQLNDNRAVYRSRLLLDEDLAARNVGLSRIYEDLGFDQLAIVEGCNSLRTDPANFSAHRFLSDAYTALPRHEIAGVSELLKSQLLQPINILPVQPRLGNNGLFIPESAGFMSPSFNEYSPLFTSNRITFIESAIGGGNQTLGNESILSGVWGKWSFSAGQLYYQTIPDPVTNDRNLEIYNVFAQTSISPSTSIQAELRSGQKKLNGDMEGNLNPTDFLNNQTDTERTQTLRLGFHHAFEPNADLIGSFMIQKQDTDGGAISPIFDIGTSIQDTDHGSIGEIQHLYRSHAFNITSGLGYFDGTKDTLSDQWIYFSGETSGVQKSNESIYTRHANMYVYSDINFFKNITWTLGSSGDFFKEFDTRNQWNPKIGVSWNPLPSTTLRMAAFRALTRTLISEQTIEPTLVAGFNQFYDDQPGTDAWQYGIAADQKFSAKLFGGAEFCRRTLKVPYPIAETDRVDESDWDEWLTRTYLYWAPHPWWTVTLEWYFEQYDRSLKPDIVNYGELEHLDSHRIPVGLNFFHPGGFFARVRTSYMSQSGRYTSIAPASASDSDQCWVTDASIGFRLPKRMGAISLEARNLFDSTFKFQEMDRSSPIMYPDQLIFLRLTLVF